MFQKVRKKDERQTEFTDSKSLEDLREREFENLNRIE